jgi:formate hydrogenlyase subunit 3/multisubunit Na+/H+ antiporter MnhD subunit
MTVSLGPLLAAVLLLLGAGDLTRRRLGARQARANATAWTVAALAVTVVCVPLAGPVDAALADAGVRTVTTLATGWARWTPVATALAGLVAVAVAPMRTHTRSTFTHALVVVATGLATTATGEPAVIVALWALACAATWRELRGRLGSRGPARLFAVHQVFGLMLAAFGVTVLAVHDAPGWAGAIGTAAIGAAVTARLGLLPLHLWVSGLVESAPMGLVVVFLAAPTAPMLLLAEGIPAPGTGLLVIGAVSALLGGLLGLVQPDARRGLSALAVSVSGIVACGVADASPTTVAGAVLAWQVYAVGMAGALMVLSATEARRGPIGLTGAGGSFARTPKLAVAFLLLGLAVAGFPATLGFVGEDLLVEGTRESSPLLMLALVVATAANGAMVVRWFFTGYTGRRDHVGELDLTRREFWAVTAALTALLVGGLAPGGLVPKGHTAPPANCSSTRLDPSPPRAPFCATTITGRLGREPGVTRVGLADGIGDHGFTEIGAEPGSATGGAGGVAARVGADSGHSAGVRRRDRDPQGTAGA